ncbi:MAG TPA: hypothetical protein VGB85_00935 [Nannocystis sp.]|jgi:hypothetical protein
MDRLSHLLATLRVVLVAVSVCLLGAASRTEHCIDRSTSELQTGHAQADDFDFPEPSPVVAQERDEDPRGGTEDDAAHGSHGGLAWLTALATGIHMIRGPPPAPRGVTWRPRSSRGPPAQV